MRSYQKTIRVVLASPSDVDNERRIAKEVIESVNRVVGAELGIVVQLSRWEDAPAAVHADGPQGHIDSELQIPDCDLIVGVFGMRFGFNTEHEIRQALESWRHKQRPQVMLYFLKKGILPRDTNELEHLAKLLKFRAEIGTEALFKEYIDENDFREQLRADLTISVLRQAGQTHLASPLGERELFVATSAVPTIMRAEGITEMAGDLELTLWTPHESLTVTAGVTIWLNTNITNRISGFRGEASSVRLVRAGHDNHPEGALALGRILAVNSVVFHPVTLTVGRSSGPVTLLIQGIRASAIQLGHASLVMSLLRIESENLDIRILNPQQTIGIPFPSFSFSIRTASDQPLVGPVTVKASGDGAFDDARTCCPADLTLLLEFTESIPAAFTTKSQEDGGDVGTRFRVDFSNLNEGMELYVTRVNTVIGSTISTGARSVKAVAVEQGQMAEFDSCYGGSSIPIRKLEMNGGSAVAVWEWISDDPLSPTLSERVSFGVLLRCKPGTRGGIMAVLGELGLGWNRALEAIYTADRNAPIPRFGPSHAYSRHILQIVC